MCAWCVKDEDDIIDLAKEQFRVLKGETEFRYGYKIVVILSSLAAEGRVVSIMICSGSTSLSFKSKIKMEVAVYILVVVWLSRRRET